MSNLHEHEIREAVALLGIETRDGGDELKFQHCPYCEVGGTKEPYAHFAVNAVTGLFNCMRTTCGARGNIFRLLSDFGKYDFVKASGQRRSYKRPLERPELVNDTDRFYAWYAKERGVSADVLKRYGVGYEKQEGKRFAIVYHYRNEQGELINRKFRLDDKSKMWTEKDCELGYYGLQHVKAGDTLYVCEGEDDCHALAQMGLDTVVSVPSGAGTYTPAMDAVNGRYPWLVLLFDNDAAGQVGARKFGEKAGVHKCLTVVLPYKDARECLLNGMDIFGLQKEIRNARRFEFEDIEKAAAEKDRIIEHLLNPQRACGKPTPSDALNRILGGIRLKELTVVIGHSGMGKTTFALNVATWMEAEGEMRYPVLVLPFENRIESTIQKMVEIRTNRRIYTYDDPTRGMLLTVPTEWIAEQIDELDKRQVWFLNKRKAEKYGYYSVDKVDEIIRCAVKYYDVRFVVIDHLHYFLRLSESEHPVLVIDEAMRRLKLLTEELDIHLMLIVHPSKTEDGKNGKLAKLTMNSGKGASSIVQECDNYLTVERREQNGKFYCEVTVHKNRAMAYVGKATFAVGDNRNTYTECAETLPDEPRVDTDWIGRMDK